MNNDGDLQMVEDDSTYEVWLPGSTQYAFTVIMSLTAVCFYSWRLRLVRVCTYYGT